MAAGTTIQLKRKAGAFTGGDLAAGEAGVDTNNGEFYFSADGSTVKCLIGGILKRELVRYTPSAAQSLTTTYADIDGSDISFTPVSASSTIVYSFKFYVAPDAAESPTSHFGLMVDGSFQSQGKITEDRGTHEGGFITYEKAVPSWGTSAKTMKLQGREFNETTDTKVHETRYMDGVFLGAGMVLVEALLTVTEYLS